jgi:uncharacterized sporulation protein YeaH/YhbH (DUF444 family)
MAKGKKPFPPGDRAAMESKGKGKGKGKDKGKVVGKGKAGKGAPPAFLAKKR